MSVWKRRFLIYIVVSALGALFLVSRLPSRREIARKLTEREPPSSLAVAAASLSEASHAGALAGEEVGSPSPVEAAAPVPAEKARQLQLMLRVLDEDPRDVRVCEQLGQSKAPAPGGATERNYSVEDLFGADRSDALMEAYRMPVRAIFQDPVVSALLREVEHYGPELDAQSAADREGFFGKVGFYARVARAGVTLMTSRRKFEKLGDRATHLSVLAKIALLQPALREDARVGDLCRTIQNDPLSPTADGLREERRQVLALLEEKGIQPKEVDFDPAYWTRFSVKQAGSGLTLQLTSKEELKN